jgi:hypothetical protein
MPAGITTITGLGVATAESFDIQMTDQVFKYRPDFPDRDAITAGVDGIEHCTLDERDDLVVHAGIRAASTQARERADGQLKPARGPAP